MRARYSEEFKKEAVRQVTENGYTIKETANRLGIHPTSLSNWVKQYQSPEAEERHKEESSSQVEIKRLQKELKRVTEERDILKKAAAYFASNPD
jgi:transposase